MIVNSDNKQLPVNREDAPSSEQTTEEVNKKEQTTETPQTEEAKEAKTEETQEKETTKPEEKSVEAQYYDQYFGEDKKAAPVTPPEEPKKTDVLSELKDLLNDKAKSKEPNSFKEFIAAGDWNGAEDYVVKRAEQALKAKLQEDSNTKNQEVLQSAMEGAVAKVTIQTKIDGIMNANPELRQFQDYISFEADKLVKNAQDAGKITTVSQYTEATIAAIQKITGDLKGQIAKTKGKAAEESRKRSEEVLAATTTIPDNKESSDRDKTEKEQTTSMPSASDYVAARNQETGKYRKL